MSPGVLSSVQRWFAARSLCRDFRDAQPDRRECNPGQVPQLSASGTPGIGQHGTLSPTNSHPPSALAYGASGASWPR